MALALGGAIDDGETLGMTDREGGL